MARERDPLARGFPKAAEAFGFTANRSSYIPREATERALTQLVECVRGGETIAALTGPPGLGKSLLLHLLAERLELEFHAVFLPYGALAPEELAAYALDRLGSPRTDSPQGVLKAYARHLLEEESGLLLLVDDAGAMPRDTARWLCELARESGGAVRCVFAVTDDAASGEVVASLGTAVPAVRLATPMTREETANYVEAHLAVGRVSGAVRALFDANTITRLHETSGGVPRRLHTAAQAVLRQDPAAAAEEAEPMPLDDAASAFDNPPPEAGGGAEVGVAPAIREEIERLRRDIVAQRGAAETPAPSGRAWVMAIAFAAAAVAGLLIAFATRPLSAWLVRAPAPPPPAVVAPEPATGAAPEASEVPVSSAAPADGVFAEPTAAPEPAPEPIPVNINAAPWASIEVDGEPLGETPLADVPIAPGMHTFRALLPDGQIVERVVEIDADNRFVVFDVAPAASPGAP